MSSVALEGEGVFCGARQGAIRRKERITATLWSVTLLLSPALGLATDIDASSFRCITKMTPVRQFYVDNLQGSLDATLATFAEGRRVSTGIRHSIDPGRSHGQAGQGLQRGNA